MGIVASRDRSRKLTIKSTRGTFVLHLARLLGLGDERLNMCVRGSVTSRMPANPKESRDEQRVQKDDVEVRLLTKSVSESN